MNIDQQLRQIISQAVAQYYDDQNAEKTHVVYSVSAILEKATQAQQKLCALPLKGREKIIQAIRTQMASVGYDLLKAAIDQTKMGCLDDKLINLNLILNNTPGLGDLAATVNTGDDGLTLNEYSAYGVIASIVPVNNLIETIICNSIGMISAGNAVVFVSPDSIYPVAQQLVAELAKILVHAGAPEHLVALLPETQAVELVGHEQVDMVVVTGMPDTALQIPLTKKTIITGCAHAPVVVDQTANIEQAAQDIVAGAAFDNNLSFIAEKAIVVVDSVADYLLHHLAKEGAYVVTDDVLMQKLEALAQESMQIPSSFKGRSAGDILYFLGIQNQQDARLIIVEVDNGNHPLLTNNLMAPILPLIRAKNVHRAITLAKEIEGGCKHTAIMHSKHIDHLTECARTLQVVLFVKNAPSYAGLGLRGEGYTSFTIAAVTGEGPTSARHFGRNRRCVLSEGFLIK